MQVVGYAARVEDPAAMVVAEAGATDRITLDPGAELSFSLGERHCAGTIDDGTHDPCSREASPYCEYHTDRWPCARCVGECSLPLDSCREVHAIYLAGFAPATFKVGVTRAWRLDTRLREQGADRAAHLRTVKDGRIARQIEADIATEIGDRVRVPTKIEGLHESFDEDAWESLLEKHGHEERYNFDYGVDLAERPQQEIIASGQVIGTKGRVLVIENAGSTYAVDLRDLVGYELLDGTPDRALQSSLGAF